MATNYQRKQRQLENVLRMVRECTAHVERRFGRIDPKSSQDLIAAFVALAIEGLAKGSGIYYGWMSFYACCEALQQPFARFVPQLEELPSQYNYGVVLGSDGRTLATLTIAKMANA